MTGFNSKRMMAREAETLNERIKELAQQAGFKVNWHNADVQAIKMARLEKFAELIIQECLNICEDMGDNGKDGHYCADKIAKTFRN